MQNSRPYLRFAGTAPRKGMRKSPRRSRRGAIMPAALLAVLLFTVLLSQFAQAQLRHAHAARAQARAVQLAAIAADFDYYVHDNRQTLANGLTQAAARGRALTPAERIIFEDNYLRVGLNRQIPEFPLTYLVGRIDEGDEVFGGLLLGNSGPGNGSEPEMAALMSRLASFGAQDSIFDRAGFVQNVLGRALTGSERVILTAPLSALGTKYVLRDARAGHRAPKLVGTDLNAGSDALDLNGNNLVNVGTLVATGGDKSAATRVVGTLHTPEMTGTLTALRQTAASTATAGLARRPESGDSAPARRGDIEISGTTGVAGTFTVEGTLTAGGLNIPAESRTEEDATGTTVTIGGPITLSRHLQTGTLSTSGLRAASLATQRITISGRITAQNLVAGTLLTPTLSNIRPQADGAPDLTARQVFTERAEITNLQTGGCTGC